MNPREWWWIDTAQNIADLTSKPCTPGKIGKDSAWQNGPKFLTLPMAMARPISQKCESELTDRVGIIMTVAKVNQDITNLEVIAVERFSNYHKLLRVTCRIMAVF